ncbi:MAG: class I SAM-dependent methyltransferase [Magnetovibrionaceae bacterium]
MLTDLADKLTDIREGRLTEAQVYAGSKDSGIRLMPRPNGGLICPICGTQAARFLPFGLNGRRNARCPGCGSVERHRYLWLFLLRSGLLKPGIRILHVAAEAGIRARLEEITPHYLAIDAFNAGADRRMDLTDLDLPDRSFDLILCSHVLEHVEDDRKAISEMARVLKTSGRLIVMVPQDMSLARTYEDFSITDPEARHRAFGHPYHVRVCGADYADRLRDGGMAVTSHFSKALSGHVRRQFRLNKAWLHEAQLRGAKLSATATEDQ